MSSESPIYVILIQISQLILGYLMKMELTPLPPVCEILSQNSFFKGWLV